MPVATRRQLRQNNDNRWDFLAGVLPHGICPTDIDLMYERRGYFLVLEGKREGATFATGQRRFYNALHRPPRFIVVHFYGTPPDEVTSFGRWGAPAHSGDTDALVSAVQRWFAWAELQPISTD